MSALPIIITTVGLAKIVNAQANGTAAVVLSAAGLTAAVFTPDPSMTALPGEALRLDTISGEAASPDVIHLVIRDTTDAAYTVTGFGVYDSDGDLFAVYGQATTIVQKAAQAELMLAVDILLHPGSATAVTFGSTDFLNPPATEETVGVVRLATAAETLAGADDTTAVTPAHAKAVYQLILGFVPVQQGGGVGQGVNKINLGWDTLHLRLSVDGADEGDLAFVSELNAVSVALNTAIAGKQAALGFTPVRQGGGPGQADDQINLGWDMTHLRLAVDGADQGELAFLAEVNAAVATINAALAGKQAAGNYQGALGFTPVQQGGAPSQEANKLNLGWDTTHLRVGVDGADQGELAFLAEMNTALAGKQAALGYLPAHKTQSSLGVTGWRWNPDDGFLEQWTEVDQAITAEGALTIQLPKVFDAAHGASLNVVNSSGSTSDNTTVQRTALTTSTVGLVVQDSQGNSSAYATGVSVRAWGVCAAAPADNSSFSGGG